MKPTKKVKRHVKNFLRMRIKWSKYMIGIRFPFDGYVTKGQYLEVIKRFMKLNPCDPDWKKEYDFYKNQSADLDDIYYYFEADDKEYSIHPTHPTWSWLEFLGLDHEWFNEFYWNHLSEEDKKEILEKESDRIRDKLARMQQESPLTFDKNLVSLC